MKKIKIIFTLTILGTLFSLIYPAQTKIPTEKEFINIIRTKGVAEAVELFRLIRKLHPGVSIFERRALNNLGWELASAGELENAIEVFKLNIEAYPDHYDPYDSYAEALVMRGDYESALKNYRKSVELNPDNSNAARGIAVLENYNKREYMIPMRDGVKLYTQVYIPKDTSQTYPMLLLRDMYSVGNYGNTYRKTLGPSDLFTKEGFIFVYQDIRGRFKSEGDYAVLRPYLPDKRNPQDIDESSDTHDTVEWLLKNIPQHNGRVGQWGGSYSGWLTVMGMIDAHPALRAFSPAAAPSDWWLGDDCHHNGAFRLMYAFDWINNDARPRKGGPTTTRISWFDYGTPDGYKFYLDLGPISNINARYLHDSNPTWNEYMEHGDYDEYWRKRDILQHLGHVTQPVLNVAAWFDAEDFRGPLSIYSTIEKNNPENKNILVIGPWRHGGWHGAGAELGDIRFDQETGPYFMKEVEFPFFMYYLKDKGDLNLPEAMVFETGKNGWRSYDRWPPGDAAEKRLYLQGDGKLSFTHSLNMPDQPYAEFISDPDKPVPWSAAIQPRQGHLWMVEDQRFAARRPDVLVYQSEILTEDMTIAGPIIACLHVSTTGTDADWIVKLIDVYPSKAPNDMGDYQMLLAGDVFRSKYRKSFVKPEPMVPNQVTQITFNLWDKYHCFLKGHRIMVQVQSTWFPVIDRNPQNFVDIYHSKENDFQKAVHRIYHSPEYHSYLKVLVMSHGRGRCREPGDDRIPICLGSLQAAD
jgi:putative CocE/NonD family hydrolase